MQSKAVSLSALSIRRGNGPSVTAYLHAGHGLAFDTAEQIAALPAIAELNIGHFLIGEAVFDGLTSAIGLMKDAIARGRQAAVMSARRA